MVKTYIRQSLFDRLKTHLRGGPNLIQVVSGPRQVGKTTLALQILKEWQGAKMYETADHPNTRPIGWIAEQ